MCSDGMKCLAEAVQLPDCLGSDVVTVKGQIAPTMALTTLFSPSRLGLAAVPERSEVIDDRIHKPKKSSKGRSKSRKHSDGSTSQVYQPATATYTDTRCIRRKKRPSRQDPLSRLSALRDELCHRSLSDDRAAILTSTEPDDSSGHATLL